MLVGRCKSESIRDREAIVSQSSFIISNVSLPTLTITCVSRYRVRGRIILRRPIFQWDVGDVPCARKKHPWVVAGKILWPPFATPSVFPPTATPPDAVTGDETKDYHSSQKNVRQVTEDFFLQFFSLLAGWDW